METPTLPFTLVTNGPCNNKGIDAQGNETTDASAFARFESLTKARRFAAEIGRSLWNVTPVTFEYATATVAREDRWVPACGGAEVPFHKDGKRWLRVFNPELQESGYLNLDTDIVYLDGSDEVRGITL